MEETILPGTPELSGEVLLYTKPEPLSKEQHGALGVIQSDSPFAFAAGAHVAPLTVTEFALAALSFPVIFVGDARQPVAVLGLNAGENLFTNDNGLWDFDAYVPAYVRRYPFVLAEDKAAERMIVCIDRAAPMISDKPDAPFFENGEPTDLTKNAIEFCNNFETERRRTESFVELLKSLDLFEVKEATFTPRDSNGAESGETQKIADYFAVSEEKLNKIPTDKLVELRDNGALQQIYAHLNSLLGWERLIVKAMNRANARQPQAANN